MFVEKDEVSGIAGELAHRNSHYGGMGMSLCLIIPNAAAYDAAINNSRS